MLNIIAILSLFTAFAALISLIVIDLKHRLLPNILVLALSFCGIAFHLSTQLYYDDPTDLFLGAIIGGGLLYVVRMAGNYYYKTDTLGLGDVKFMAACGLWLGSSHISGALIIGAIAGLLHGAIMITYGRLKTGKMPALSSYSLPAGPGFAVGFFIMALAKFHTLAHVLSP